VQPSLKGSQQLPQQRMDRPPLKAPERHLVWLSLQPLLIQSLQHPQQVRVLHLEQPLFLQSLRPPLQPPLRLPQQPPQQWPLRRPQQDTEQPLLQRSFLHLEQPPLRPTVLLADRASVLHLPSLSDCFANHQAYALTLDGAGLTS
jgi:hypothetical protein